MCENRSVASICNSDARRFVEQFATGGEMGSRVAFLAFFGPLSDPEVRLEQPPFPAREGWDDFRRFFDELFAAIPDLTGEVWLYDIEMESARLNERFGNWMQGQPGVLSKWRYIAEPTLDKTLQGADFVVISIQPGTLEVMGQNIAIAARYGMHYPVGDTTGAPGLMRGLFSAIVYAGFARSIAEHCPNAWIINYTNPMTMCTRTLTKVAPGLKVFGCCHAIFGTQKLLADLVAQHWHEHTPRAEIEVNVIGINHFT